MSQDTHMFSVRRHREVSRTTAHPPAATTATHRKTASLTTPHHQTLGSVNPNVSAIPMPSSAMKRSNSGQNLASAGAFAASQHAHARSMSGSRHSLMPGRPSQPVFQRSSSGAGAFDSAPMSAQRGGTVLFGGGSQSARRSLAPGALAASTPGNVLATPAAGSMQRRSSCYSARPSNGPGSNARQSFFSTAPTPAGVPQDPRRLRDISVRSQMANELLNYFTNNNFELEAQISLSNKSLSSPTQKEFNVMFQWLYKRIDPGYRFMKSMDAEIPPLLKQLHYPFEKSITKSQIAAVGGNNWHTFLGLLHWIMQLAQMMDGYAKGDYDYASAEIGHDVSSDRIIFNFLTNAYQDWLNVPDGADDDAADQVIQHHVDRMAAQFKEVNKDLLDDVDMLEGEKQALIQQIEELERGNEKGKQLDERLAMLKEDTDKHEDWCGKVENKINKYQDKIKRLEEEIKKVETETDETKDEKRGYQQAISDQGITVQDLDRMTSETERLEGSRRAIRDRLDETKQQLSEKEADASRKLEELDRHIEKFNALGYKIGIIPASAPHARGVDYELGLTIKDEGADFISSQLGRSQSQDADQGHRLLRDSTSGYLPDQLLNKDIRPQGSLKNSIVSLRKAVSERRNAALEEDMKNHDMLDGVKEALDEKKGEVEGLSHRIRAAEEEFERTREITTTQKTKMEAQLEKMEKELSMLRSGVAESVQMMEQREINTNLEYVLPLSPSLHSYKQKVSLTGRTRYEQLTLRAAALREELHTEIEKILNDVIKFKIHVQTGLEGYEQFVDEEVSGEYEDLQREQDAEDLAAAAALNQQQEEGVLDEEALEGAEMDVDR
jgi:kinetochore protein NDC80